jgi:AraC-like DNA-binding protein
MESHKIKFINSNELQVAASCEASSIEITEVYFPSTLLFFAQVGQINVKHNQELLTVGRGRFGLLRKYTQCEMFKSWSQEEGQAKTYTFVLTNDFIKRVIHNIEMPKDITPVDERFINLQPTALLQGLMNSLIAYIDEGIDLEPQTMELKTLEALHALIKADPRLYGVFKEFAISERADLEQLMNHNFRFNIPLDDLAKQSGRSLSTFNREFKALFNDTPHKWIKKKRLQFARNMMVTKNKRPSEVYLEAGFEDLAHFSKSFKSFFNITPSQFYQSLV